MKTILQLAVFLMALNSFAGGDLVNNGGGIAEKNVIFAYQRLDEYLRMCLSSDFCKLSIPQRTILTRIAGGLNDERKGGNQVQFDSEKNHPGTFIIDYEVKVAKTGSTIGSLILINSDLLYTKNELGFYIPMSVSEAVAVLVHELGHHYGNYSHTDLDLLGVRVAMLLQHKTYSTPLLPWSQQISAMVINPDLDNSFPEVLLYVEDQVIDVSEQFKNTVFCPKFIIPIPILPLPDIPISPKKPLGSLMHNVHWNNTAAVGNKAALSISGDLSHKCRDSSAQDKEVEGRSQDYKIQIDFTVSVDSASGRWMLDQNSIKMEQKHDAWWKFITFHGAKP